MMHKLSKFVFSFPLMNIFTTSKWYSSILLNKMIVFGSHHFKSSFRFSDSFPVLKQLPCTMTSSTEPWPQRLIYSKIIKNLCYFPFFLTWEYSSISNSVYREYYSIKTHRSLRERRYLGVKLGFFVCNQDNNASFSFFFFFFRFRLKST